MLGKDGEGRVVDVVVTERRVSDTFSGARCEVCKNSGKGFWAETARSRLIN
jgi:hypothetical protein